MDRTESLPQRTTGLLGSCEACSRPLPLRLPEAGEPSLEWECVGCGARYRGVLLDDWPSEFLENVRRAGSPPVEADPATELDPSIGREAALPGEWPGASADVASKHPPIRCDLHTPLTRRLDAEIIRGVNLHVYPSRRPFAAVVATHGARLYDRAVLDRMLRVIDQSSRHLQRIFASLHTGRIAEIELAEAICRQSLTGLAEDRDLFVYLSITPSAGEYPSRHGLHVAMLATAMGVALGWDRSTLVDLGVGCLLHDVGMLFVDREVCQARRILSAPDYAEIVKHPVLTMRALERYAGEISAAAQFVAYQLHERCNGRGYPRGYASDRIHDLAKVAAVADVYVALVTSGRNRPRMIPYRAIEKLLDDTRAGFFEPSVVRALLTTTSLFPVGSHVAMNDGRVGRVVRAAGDCYDRPIVEIWRAREPHAERCVVDLGREPGLRIAGTLPGPPS